MDIIYNQQKLFAEREAAFTQWKNENTNWEADFQVVDRDQCETYKRIVVSSTDMFAKKVTYTPLINTKNGDIFLDCRRRKIYAKFLVFTFARPLITLGWTLYNGLGIGVVQALIREKKGYQLAEKEAKRRAGQQIPLYSENRNELIANKTIEIKNQLNEEVRKKKWVDITNSLKDIIRTPLYGIVLSIIDIAAVCIGPFSPNSLYRLREISGKMDMALQRIERSTLPYGLSDLEKFMDPLSANKSIFPCFFPIGNMSTVQKEWISVDTKSALSVFVKMQANFKKKNRALFNDCCQLYPSEKEYESAAYSKFKQILKG